MMYEQINELNEKQYNNLVNAGFVLQDSFEKDGTDVDLMSNGKDFIVVVRESRDVKLDLVYKLTDEYLK